MMIALFRQDDDSLNNDDDDCDDRSDDDGHGNLLGRLVAFSRKRWSAE